MVMIELSRVQFVLFSVFFVGVVMTQNVVPGGIGVVVSLLWIIPFVVACDRGW